MAKQKSAETHFLQMNTLANGENQHTIAHASGVKKTPDLMARCTYARFDIWPPRQENSMVKRHFASGII